MIFEERCYYSKQGIVIYVYNIDKEYISYIDIRLDSDDRWQYDSITYSNLSRWASPAIDRVYPTFIGFRK